MCHLFMKKVGIMGLTLFFFACGDTVINTEKSVSNSNNDFKLTLTISDEIVRSDDTIKLTAVVERLVQGEAVSSKMRMDAVGGTIDGHSFSSSSSITVSLDDALASTFEALAFFKPLESSSTGHVSVSFDGINVSMPITIVEPR